MSPCVPPISSIFSIFSCQCHVSPTWQVSSTTPLPISSFMVLPSILPSLTVRKNESFHTITISTTHRLSLVSLILRTTQSSIVFDRCVSVCTILLNFVQKLSRVWNSRSAVTSTLRRVQCILGHRFVFATRVSRDRCVASTLTTALMSSVSMVPLVLTMYWNTNAIVLTDILVNIEKITLVFP